MEGTDTLPYTDDQYAALQRLVPTLRIQHALKAVRGHEHIAPGRKTDPGPAFDWHRFSRETGWLPDQIPSDRKSVVEGKSVSVRVDLGGRRIIKKKKTKKHNRSIK